MYSKITKQNNIQQWTQFPAFNPTGIDGWRGSQGIETAAPEMAL